MSPCSPTSDSRIPWWRIGLVLLPLCSPITDAGTGGASRLGMADAMLKMMDAMGLFGAPGDTRGGRAGSPDWGSWVPNPSAPWPYANQGGPSGQPWAAGLERLQGVWISNTGEQLWIRPPRFRLQAGAGRLAEGLVQLQGDRLAFHSPELDRHWLFQYAEHEGRLVLRDDQGRLFLFRRTSPDATPARPSR